MLTLILHFAQVIVLGVRVWSEDNTQVFFAILMNFVIEIITAKPIFHKYICSKNLLSICKNGLLLCIILKHIENQYLYWIVIASCLLMITKNFTTLFIIKKIDIIIKKDYFIGIYTQLFSLYKQIQIGSYLFLTALFLQLELHTIVLEDQWKINSLIIANFSFIPFAAQIILNIIESFCYVKWALKKESKLKEQ